MKLKNIILTIYILSNLLPIYGKDFSDTKKSFLSPLSEWNHKNKALVDYSSRIFKHEKTLALSKELKISCRMNDIISIGGIRVPDSINLQKSYEFTSNPGKQSMLKMIFFEVETIFSRRRIDPIPIKEYGTREFIFSIYDKEGILGHGWIDLPSKRIKDIVRLRFGLHHVRLNRSSIPIENQGNGQRTMELLIRIILANEFSTGSIDFIHYHLSSDEKLYDLSSKARHILRKFGFSKIIDNDGLHYTLNISPKIIKKDLFVEKLKQSA